MDDQREPGRAIDDASPSFSVRGALLLGGITRAAALAECVILVLWFLVRVQFVAWCARTCGAGSDVDFMRRMVVPYVVVAGATVGLGALLLRLQKLPREALGLRTERLEGQILWGFGAALVVHGVALGWVRLAVYVQWSLWRAGHRPLWWLRGSNPLAEVESSATVGTVLILLMAGAIYEEVLYRGLLLPRLRRMVGRWWAAVLTTSLLFGAAHLASGPGNALAAFVGSIVWCVTFVWSRSLLRVVIGHFLFNATLYWFSLGRAQ